MRSRLFKLSRLAGKSLILGFSTSSVLLKQNSLNQDRLKLNRCEAKPFNYDHCIPTKEAIASHVGFDKDQIQLAVNMQGIRVTFQPGTDACDMALQLRQKGIHAIWNSDDNKPVLILLYDKPISVDIENFNHSPNKYLEKEVRKFLDQVESFHPERITGMEIHFNKHTESETIKRLTRYFSENKIGYSHLHFFPSDPAIKIKQKDILSLDNVFDKENRIAMDRC